jgi:hypothetical protein
MPAGECPGEHLRDADAPEDRRGPDGLLVCGADDKPAYYCTALGDYFHVDDDARCFLIHGGHPARPGRHGPTVSVRVFLLATPFDDGEDSESTDPKGDAEILGRR